MIADGGLTQVIEDPPLLAGPDGVGDEHHQGAPAVAHAQHLGRGVPGEAPGGDSARGPGEDRSRRVPALVAAVGHLRRRVPAGPVPGHPARGVDHPVGPHLVGAVRGGLPGHVLGAPTGPEARHQAQRSDTDRAGSWSAHASRTRLRRRWFHASTHVRG